MVQTVFSEKNFKKSSRSEMGVIRKLFKNKGMCKSMREP